MVTIEIRIQPGKVPASMNQMRLWLDERRYEPSSFICNSEAGDVVVLVQFKITEEAIAFAEQFAGRVLLS